MKAKTKLFTLISLLAAVLCTVTSCDSLETDATIPVGDAPIRFRIDVAPPAAVSPHAGPQTRVSTDVGTSLTSAFTAGDRVGLYIVKGDAGLQASGNYADNLALTFDGTAWTCPDMPSFPADGSALSFYAYYPYDAALASPLAIAHRVSADQQPGTPEGFADSYLLSATTKGITAATSVVELTFTHRLALLRVKLNNGDSPSEQPADGPDEVMLKNVLPALTLNLADGTTAPNASAAPAADIRMRLESADGCWYALVPEQSIERTETLLTFEWKDITTLAYTPKDASGNENIVNLAALEAGKVHTLNVTIKLGGSNIDPYHVYSVGDFYPYWGFEKWGIVYKVSEDGTSGMMMSTEESAALAWRNDEAGSQGASGVLDVADGLANMWALSSSTSGAFTGFPAFYWCHFTMNDGSNYKVDYTSRDVWYIPSREELQELKALIGKGIPGFDGSTYWSSTESEEEALWAYSLTMTADGTPQNEVKTEARKVRVVRQFGN